MLKHDPEQLERDWREALAALLGEELEAASVFVYLGRGWYHTSWAYLRPDGSIGCVSQLDRPRRRASRIIAETATIRARAAADNKRPKRMGG